VRAGADRGRIWRVFPAGKRPRPSRALAKFPPGELAAVVASPNGVERDLAHRLLLEAAPNANVVRALEKIGAESPYASSRAQALAILSALGKLDPARRAAAVRDEDPRVRRFAVSLSESGGLLDSLLPLIADPDAGVRYQLALTLGEFSSEPAGRALADLAARDGASAWPRAAKRTLSSRSSAKRRRCKAVS